MRKHQKGSALITVMSLSVLLFLAVGLSTTIVNRSGKDTQENFRKRSQAANIARAGLTDAVGWFKKKSQSGPVSQGGTSSACADEAFAPVYDSDPLLRETIDPSVGIVKDIPLDLGRKIFGRYIVRRQPCDVNASSEAGLDVVSTESTYDKYAAHDISEESGRGARGDGIVWNIVSEGIVYRRPNLAKNADGVFTAPIEEANILERSRASVNINQLSLNPPQAPITILEPEHGGESRSSLNNRCDVLGVGATATVIYNTATKGGQTGQSPSGSANCEMEDCPPPPSSGDGSRAALIGTDVISVEDVFSVPKSDLKAVSDYVHNNMNELKNTHYDQPNNRISLPMALYYLDGNYTFDLNNQLLGSGILFVDGNLTLNPSSFSFSGMVYVTGTLRIEDDNTISGAVMANRVDCTPGLKAEVERNAGVLENVRNSLALYRENTLSYVKGSQ